jgi:hypothetical protein
LGIPQPLGLWNDRESTSVGGIAVDQAPLAADLNLLCGAV